MRLSVKNVLLLLAFGVVGCSTEKRSEGLGPHSLLSAEHLQPVVKQLFGVALDNVIEAHGEPRERIVLRGDVAESAALAAYGLSLSALTQDFAADRGLEVLPRDAVMSCQGRIGPGNWHPCRLNFDGAYYGISVVSFTLNTANVVVFAVSGWRDMEMVSSPDGGWKVVKYSDGAT